MRIAKPLLQTDSGPPCQSWTESQDGRDLREKQSWLPCGILERAHGANVGCGSNNIPVGLGTHHLKGP